jgi:hypothetical protein
LITQKSTFKGHNVHHAGRLDTILKPMIAEGSICWNSWWNSGDGSEPETVANLPNSKKASRCNKRSCGVNTAHVLPASGCLQRARMDPITIIHTLECLQRNHRTGMQNI